MHIFGSILGTTYGWSQEYKRVGTLKMSRFGQYSSHVHKYMPWMLRCCLYEAACTPCLKGKRILDHSNYCLFQRENRAYHYLRLLHWGRSMLLRPLRSKIKQNSEHRKSLDWLRRNKVTRGKSIRGYSRRVTRIINDDRMWMNMSLYLYSAVLYETIGMFDQSTASSMCVLYI